MRTLRRHRALRSRWPLLAAALVGVLALGVATPVLGAGSAREEAASWRVAFDPRPFVSMRERVIVVLEAPSLADRMLKAGGSATVERQRRWNEAVEAGQKRLLKALRVRGVDVRRDFVFSRTLNGFSAVVDGKGRAALERARGVAGVYPVRTVYAASVSSAVLEQPAIAADTGRRPGASPPGIDGAGVTIALLDTGVDLAHPFLAARFLPGFDVIGGDGDPAAEAHPGDATQLERHGTQMAGLIAGSGGPAGLTGVAPGAALLPIRVLGWQEAADGSWQLFGRGDQLLAGIERAVDPNGDGAVDDRARIALAALVEPYAAFADSPEARAVAGASALGTLVVAPTGNDGPSLAGYGTVGAPASAPHSLAVGAADLRDTEVRTLARVTIDGVSAFEAELPLLGSVAPGGPLALLAAAVSLPAPPEGGGEPPARLTAFVDGAGVSTVGGQAVVVAAPESDLEGLARDAAGAGAAALLLTDGAVPSGAVDLAESSPIPVVALPEEAGRAVNQAIAAGATVMVSLDPVLPGANAGDETVAPFSSRGLAFDGRLRPDVVAAGIGLATADAGRAVDGSPLFATVTGSSAAAAVAAGTAALVAQARPRLDASALRAAIVGGARPLVAAGSYAPAAFQGAGAVDAAGAIAAEVVIEPATLAIGRIGADAWSGEIAILARNLGDRQLSVGFGLVPDGDAAERLRFAADPARLELGPGEARTVRLTVSGDGQRPGNDWVSGTIVAGADGGPLARVPWATALAEVPEQPLVSAVRLSSDRFEADGTLGALLTFRAGWLAQGDAGVAIGALGLLDVELWRGDTRIALAARLRDLLPGRYAVGLTGLDSGGKVLAPGRYTVRFVTRPADGHDGSARTVEGPSFRIVAPSVARTVAAAPTGLTWGGVQFGAGERGRFARWLDARGASYAEWRERYVDLACQAFDDCR